MMEKWRVKRVPADKSLEDELNELSMWGWEVKTVLFVNYAGSAEFTENPPHYEIVALRSERGAIR